MQSHTGPFSGEDEPTMHCTVKYVFIAIFIDLFYVFYVCIVCPLIWLYEVRRAWIRLPALLASRPSAVGLSCGEGIENSLLTKISTFLDMSKLQTERREGLLVYWELKKESISRWAERVRTLNYWVWTLDNVPGVECHGVFNQRCCAFCFLLLPGKWK